jgi:hypothetical protein
LALFALFCLAGYLPFGLVAQFWVVFAVLAGFGPDFGSQFGKFGPFGTREIYRHYAPIFTRFAAVAGFRLFGHLGQPQVGPSADPILAIWDPF